MPIAEIVISVFIVAGGIFGLIGSIGLVKLPSQMSRLHSPTKATTLGVGGVLIASMMNAYAMRGEFSFHELLITLFLFLTAPITAHFIAKAYIHRHADEANLPDAGTDRGWAVTDRPEVDDAKGNEAEGA